jgi:hypothetical protein
MRNCQNGNFVALTVLKGLRCILLLCIVTRNRRSCAQGVRCVLEAVEFVLETLEVLEGVHFVLGTDEGRVTCVRCVL